MTPDDPTFVARILAATVAREHGLRLAEVMFAGMVQKLCGAQFPVGDPGAQFVALERLCGRNSTLRQLPGPLEVGLCLSGLGLRPLEGCASPFACCLGGAKAFFRFATAAWVEKGWRRRLDGADHIAGLHGIASLEVHPGRLAGQGRRNDVSLADPRFSVFIHGCGEAAGGDGSALHQHRWGHQPPRDDRGCTDQHRNP